MPNRFLLGALLGLAACAPYQGFYRAGVDVARMNSDLTACEVAAVQSVPPNTQVRRTPVRWVPGRQVCKPDGTCYITESDVVGGEAYTVDLNAPLRDRVLAQCMAEKGYQRVTIPLCSGDVARQARALAPRTLPPLGPNLCAAPANGAGYVFVTTAPG